MARQGFDETSQRPRDIASEAKDITQRKLRPGEADPADVDLRLNGSIPKTGPLGVDYWGSSLPQQPNDSRSHVELFDGDSGDSQPATSGQDDVL